MMSPETGPPSSPNSRSPTVSALRTSTETPDADSLGDDLCTASDRHFALARRAITLVMVWLALFGIGWAVGAIVVAVAPHFDSAIVHALHVARGGALVTLARDVTFLGSPGWLDVVFLVVAGALLMLRRWQAALFLTLASPGIVVMHQILQAIVGRVRPAGIHLTSASGSSWPSGHAMESTALYGALVLLALGVPALRTRPMLRKLVLGSVALVLIMIGLSRVLLGVHYPSDVVGGWLLTTGWLAALQRLGRPGVRARDADQDVIQQPSELRRESQTADVSSARAR